MIAAAEMTPSGVPPIPHRRSTPVDSETAKSAAETSPSEISRMRPPTSRIFGHLLLVARAVEHHHRHAAGLGSLALGDPLDDGRERLVEREEVGDVGAARELLHVDAWAGIEHRAPARRARSRRARRACPWRTASCPRAGPPRYRPSAGCRRRSARRCRASGASSFSPSPITTMPSIGTVSSRRRIASTAAWSAASLSPRPVQRAAASAAASVTRTSSSARLRSGFVESRTS